ncbi:MAG: dipeptide epimerase [Thaumarchaeota archaeon]|jgi:o-succinylbenzoate synthase|nr:dipeptide epimerase [Nitrososphaerota archaeon]
MGIERVEVYSVTLRYFEPFRIAPGSSEKSRNIVVRIVTDYGVEGWGEASPSKRVTGETVETVLEVLSRIAPRLIGMCPLRVEQNVEMMDRVVEGNPAAKAAIDTALHDILGKTAGKPLFMLLGGFRTQVLTDFTLSIKTPREMAADAVKAVEKGFRALKVKVGVNPSEDVERIRMVREAVGEGVEIRVDANEGWSPDQAVEVLNRVEKFRIRFVEQPVPAHDVKGLARVRRDSPIPVMADESVHSPSDALRLIREEAVDMINIKLAKSGGILKARKISDVAEAAGVSCMVGCMSESEIGIAAGAHLAAGVRNIEFADLDCDLLHADKLVKKGGVTVSGSMRLFPKGSGLGLEELDAEILGKPLAVYK